MTTKTLTVDGLIAEYAKPLADAVGITLDGYYRTPEGFPQFLTAVAARLSPLDQTRYWLDEAATDLDVIARTEATGKKAQKLLKRVDNTLYEARAELELI